MKKYTNKILIITAIVLALGIVIGYTIDFQTGYRNGRIKYEEIKKDSVQLAIQEALNEANSDTAIVKTVCATSQRGDETAPENEPETSHQ